jgi:hypothetical protein
MMSRMRSNDLDNLGDELEPPPHVPGVPARKVAPMPPRLCEAGPCVHYHRFAIQLDAEGPKAESIDPGGKMSGPYPKQPFHIRVHHYCYPTVGVETELGALPVMQCNLWEPIADVERRERENRIRLFESSDRGQSYAAELAAWQAVRDAEAAEDASADDEIAAWVTMNMRDGDQIDVLRDGDGKLNTLAGEACYWLAESWLRETHGPGVYCLRIMRIADDVSSVDVPREMVNEKKVEVK